MIFISFIFGLDFAYDFMLQCRVKITRVIIIRVRRGVRFVH